MATSGAPSLRPGDSGSAHNGARSSQPETTSSSASIAKLRKRTKTGCLTCRQRRIKCDEERPICSNCTKSKRGCNFTQPSYHDGLLGSQHYRPVPPPINTDGFMPIRMQPGQPYAIAENGQPLFSPPQSSGPFMQNMNGLPLTSPRTPFPPAWTPITPQCTQTPYGQSPMSAMRPQNFPPNFLGTWQPTAVIASASVGFAAPEPPLPPQYSQHTPLREDFPRPSLPAQDNSILSESRYSSAHIPAHAGNDGSILWLEGNHINQAQTPDLTSVQWGQLSSEGQHVSPQFSATAPNISPSSTAPNAAVYLGPSITGAAAQFLEDAAIESLDDGYYDVEADEEMEDISERASHQLTIMRRLHEEHFSELSMRTYDTFLYNGILTDYRPGEHANPLNNSTTARVFAHFISATGPSLSIFERHPRNPSAMFNDTLTDRQQGIWTYTLPMKAMYNPGLLQAMLALASLHISKLQGTTSVPASKHYSWAVKNIHRRVGNPKQRLLPTTIAATLLLGFYEILTADHQRWSTHLLGARQLLTQLDFKDMAKQAQRHKAQQLAEKEQFSFYETGFNPHVHDFTAAIDENLVSSLVGKRYKVEQFGQVLGEESAESATKPSKPFDMEKYELYQDLYWWYARQDVYQAILSGNNLLFDFHRWTDCPPRAGMGRSDAIYGTHDHLVLLFARIADFNAKDRSRKIRVMNTQGGHWRPAPGMNMGRPPGQGPPQGPPPGHATSHASYVCNPNAAFMHAKASQHAGMPPPGGLPHQMHNHLAQGQETYSNMGAGQGSMPKGFNGMPGGPMGSVRMPQQNFMGASPNFKHEPSFDDSSAKTPFSAQPVLGPPFHSPESMPRGSYGGPSTAFPPPPPPPMFYGMAPLPTTVNMPSSYASHSANATPSPKSEKGELDLDAAMQNAMTEWTDLKIALNTWKSHLGPHFQPMPEDVYLPTMTPFGFAVFYRSHDVGVIWAMYYMACIILERTHPNMPPAAMMAAGVASRQTSEFAQQIGRIIGGIVPPEMGHDLSPSLGACLCECSLPLFFAGVQYQDPTQRAWLVSLLRNVEIRTGWKSIGMVAQGCETAWEKASGMGHGPPYKRTVDQWHVDTAFDSRVARITGNYAARDYGGSGSVGPAQLNPQSARVHWAMGILGVVEDGDENESRHVSGVQPAKEPPS